MRTQDFTLHLDEHEGCLAVHGDARPLVGEATHRLNAQEFRQLVQLGSLLNDDVTPSREEGAAAGALLFRALLGGGVHQIYGEAVKRAEGLGCSLRIVLKYDLPPAGHASSVHEVPWELLFEPDRGRFLVLDEHFLFVRHLRGGGRAWESLESSPRVLLTAACPRGQEPLSLKRELQQVRLVLSRPPFSPKSPVQIWNVGKERLKKEFNNAVASDEPFQVWHHCGHGGRSEVGSFVLALHSKDGDPDSHAVFADAADLSVIVGRHPELRLVILNVCLGAGKQGLATLAAALDVPAVVGFRSKVQDLAALGFADALWRNLRRMPVDQAVREARRTMAGTAHALDFARVLLFLRCLDRPPLIAPAGLPADGDE